MPVGGDKLISKRICKKSDLISFAAQICSKNEFGLTG